MIGTNFGIFRPNKGGGGATANAGTGSTAGTFVNPDVAASNHQYVPIDERGNSHLSDFMLQLEDYVPSIPDAVTAHYLNAGGFDTSDVRIVRLISIATQKYISDIVNDAAQHCKARTHSQAVNNLPGGSKAKDRKYTLTIDDLKPALADHGIAVRKADYFQ